MQQVQIKTDNCQNQEKHDNNRSVPADSLLLLNQRGDFPDIQQPADKTAQISDLRQYDD